MDSGPTIWIFFSLGMTRIASRPSSLWNETTRRRHGPLPAVAVDGDVLAAVESADHLLSGKDKHLVSADLLYPGGAGDPGGIPISLVRVH